MKLFKIDKYYGLIISGIILIVGNAGQASSNSPENSVRVLHEYGTHFFPPHFYKPPFLAEVKQVNNDDLAEIRDVVDATFSKYSVAFHKLVDAVYVADSYNIYGGDMDVFSLGRSFYVAVNSEGKKVRHVTVREKLHKEIHSILWDYYPGVFYDSGWMPQDVFAEKFPKDSLQGLSLQDLYSMGFLNSGAAASTKQDFIQYGLWHQVNHPQLDSLAKVHPVIRQKLDRYLRIMKGFGKEDNCICDEINNNPEDISLEHDVKVDVCYDINNFPRIWTKTGRVKGSQISNENAVVLLQTVDEQLKGLEDIRINMFLRNVYLLAGLVEDKVSRDALHCPNTIYLALNEQGSLSKEKRDDITIELAHRIAHLIRLNFHWLFPEKEWGKLKNIENVREADIFFTDKYNSEILDYFTSEILFRAGRQELDPAECADTEKKKLISSFFLKIGSWLNHIYEDRGNFNDKLVNMKQQHGVDIRWEFNPADPGFVVPAIFNIQDNILYVHAYRTLPLIGEFFESFPRETIQNELNAIVLASSMHYVNSSSDIAGTYEESSRTLYLSNIGNEDEFIKGNLYHEFGHLLQSKYGDQLDAESWKNSIPDKKYDPRGINPGAYHFDTGTQYYEKGFINNYSSTRFEEDFAEFFREYYMDREDLARLAGTYKGIGIKYRILEDFLRDIGL